MNDLDRRYLINKDAAAVLKRAEGDEKQYPNIVGLAAVYYDASVPGTEFQLFDDYFERIMPGAFDRAIREGDDVRALFNHDPNWILGRTTSGTLKLSVDSKGLRYEVDPPETQQGKTVTVAIERGDVTGSSFAFVADEQVHREERRGDRMVLIREVVSVRLFDVSPVTYPAYTAATASLSSRSRAAIEDFRASLPKDDVRDYPAELARLKHLRAKVT